VGVTPSPTQQSNTSKLGWSTGYYVGWLKTKYTPEMIPWKSLTYLAQFSLLSNRDGSLTIAHQLTPEFMQATVAEAHKHNVKILITVGGADDENFDEACNANNRSNFVNNVLNVIKTYGYDGVDMDVERDFNRTDFANCFKELRRTLNTLTPQPVLAMAVVPEWQAAMTALVAQYVDQINLMSYATNVNGMGALLNKFTSLGIPKSKLGIGLGLGDGGGVDTNSVSCDAKAKYAIDNSYGGVMEWMITDDLDAHNGQTPCLDAVSNYVS
jgi:GH18 family chitinase